MPINPLLLDVPTEFETDRLLIRCPRPGDGAVIHASVVATLDSLREYPASLPWAMAEPSIQTSEQFARQSDANHRLRTAMPMLLFLKHSGEHVGSSGLHAFDWSVPKCEVGYWGHAAFRGRGLMTEAVVAITAFAFDILGMRRVECLPDDANVASWRVCERAGYVLEGVLRNDRAEPDGTLRSTRVYAAVR